MFPGDIISLLLALLVFIAPWLRYFKHRKSNNRKEQRHPTFRIKCAFWLLIVFIFVNFLFVVGLPPLEVYKTTNDLHNYSAQILWASCIFMMITLGFHENIFRFKRGK